MIEINFSRVNCQYFAQDCPIYISASAVSIGIDVCEFRSCYASEYAGAMHIYSDAGFISLGNLIIADCRSQKAAACHNLKFNASGAIAAQMASYSGCGDEEAEWGSTFRGCNVVSGCNWSTNSAKWEPAFFMKSVEADGEFLYPTALNFANIDSCSGTKDTLAVLGGVPSRIGYLNICNCSEPNRFYISGIFVLENSNFYGNSDKVLLILNSYGDIKNCYFENISMIHGDNYSLETISQKIPINIPTPVRVKSKLAGRRVTHKAISLGLVPFFYWM